MKRRDFLKLAGAAVVAPTALAAETEPVIGVDKAIGESCTVFTYSATPGDRPEVGDIFWFNQNPTYYLYDGIDWVEVDCENIE